MESYRLKIKMKKLIKYLMYRVSVNMKSEFVGFDE